MPRKKRSFPITYLFPNIITIAGLCAGLSAVRFAMLERWEMAVVFLIAAAIIDGMDGRLARMLNATSTFGAQLDSLADFVSFGVAPVMVMYLWQMHGVKGLGWLVVLFFAACMALRLARFNTSIFEGEKSKEGAEEPDDFFTGVPAPAGALLCVLPMVLSFQFGSDTFFASPIIAIFYVACIGVLLVSTLPTLSAKKFKIPSNYAGPFIIASCLFIAVWIVETWLAFTLTSLLYLATIPYTVRRAGRLSTTEDAAGDSDAIDQDSA
ncbi:MAG: phosphatidylcholine/phosphatidylserine synthase [Alphaproteobacteria bacterium]|nr:phosphatidylcholine/phosphatidylserine synthase [Alphaproteobacteria bacterium]